MSSIKEAPIDDVVNIDIGKFNGDMVKQPDGTIKFYKGGRLHRDDGPAVIYYDGTEYYYKNGKLHRDNGPAVTRLNGDLHYYKNGKLHREDGPAIIDSDGTKQYYKNGFLCSEKEILLHKSDKKMQEKTECQDVTPYIFIHVIEYKDKSQILFHDKNEFLKYVDDIVGSDYIKIFTQTISREEYESLRDI